MDSCFCLKCEDGDEQLYVDIPNSLCEKGVQLIGYEVLHGGDNQQWMWHEDQIISLMLSPSYSISVNEITNNAPVILSCTGDKTEGDMPYDKWVFTDGVIKLKADENFCIGLSDKKLVLQDINEYSATQWEIEICDSSVKPATSCHLNYRPIPKVNNLDSWTLENSVRVRRSANTTYFCIVGWGPGGYSGIQQINNDRRVVIFSMWNSGEHNVKMVECGEGVEVSPFGGEGTGMKAMKDVNWKNDQKVTFRVTGNKLNTDESTTGWRCSGWYLLEGGDWVLMASYERSGDDPPFNQHVYAFVEDWDRSCNCKGHNFIRLAEFSDAKLIMPNVDILNFDKAVFTKQRHGADKFAREKAFGGIKKSSSSFVLSTGGSTLNSIQRYMYLEKYEDCTNEHGKELLL